MKSISVKATNQAPAAEFNVEGKLLLEGRSLPENVAEFYDPLVHFASQLSQPEIVFDVNLDYFNTATSKKLLDLLKTLDANNKINAVKINWHYEDGDDDSIEMAQIYEQECIQHTQFKYIRHLETVPLEKRIGTEYLD
jgi:hypothetical protein